jgi:CheY-like chemotaxis protein
VETIPQNVRHSTEILLFIDNSGTAYDFFQRLPDSKTGNIFDFEYSTKEYNNLFGVRCLFMKKIMVVDDEKDLLAVIKELLQKRGYQVAVTTSCEEALNILSDFKPNLIFLDINIGNEDGREMCKKIKSLAEHKHIPIILMSADDSLLKTYEKYNADSYVRKPLEPAQLIKLAAQYTMAT